MKKVLLPLLFILSVSSCSMSFLREELQVNDLIKYKEKIDSTENPAEAYMLKTNLSSKVVTINGLLVKDIVESTNVDYQYCVISEIETEKGKIECQIYTKNIRRISMLVKGKSVINVRGEFSRFFSTLEDYYTNIEIINSTITIIKTEEK